MIRGRLITSDHTRRPFVLAQVAIRSQNILGDVDLLVDTGADGTLLAPSDARSLRVNVAQLRAGPSSTGVGGAVPTVYAEATISMGGFSQDLLLRILAPRSRAQRTALARIPSLLGRDLLSHFALFFEERTERVLLLEPHEADAIQLPKE